MSSDDLNNPDSADSVVEGAKAVSSEEPIANSSASRGEQSVVDMMPGYPHIFHGHNLTYAALYALVLLICGVATMETPWALIPIASLVAAVIFLVAAWSVLGPGPYLKRMFLAHMVGAIPAVGITIPIVIYFRNEPYLDLTAFMGMAIAVLPFSLGAQMAFWFLRGFLGWQLVPRGGSRGVSYSIRDIFVVTFIIAASLGFLQFYASKVAEIASVNMIDNETPVFDENGSVVLDKSGDFVMRELDAEELREERNQMALGIQSSTLMGYGISFVFAAFIAAVSIPILLRMFRSENTNDGCAYVAIYLLIIATIPAALFLGVGTIFGGMPPDIEIVMYLGTSFFGLVFGYGLALWMPLLSSREQGVQLVTGSQNNQTTKVPVDKSA